MRSKSKYASRCLFHLAWEFFSPLATPNRQHYAALLVLYYRLFQESTFGLERELVVREFTKYLAIHRDSLAEETDDIHNEDDTIPQEEETPGILEFNFDAEHESTGSSAVNTNAANRASEKTGRRRLAGWWNARGFYENHQYKTVWSKPFLKHLSAKRDWRQNTKAMLLMFIHHSAERQ